MENKAKKKYNIGYTCGVFDVFHVGHLNLLEKCKEYCEYLIVGVCDDDYVRKVKMKEPVFNEEDRLRIVKALEVVDNAVLVDIATTQDKCRALGRFGFDVLFSGDDWKGTELYNETEALLKKKDVDIVYFPYTNGISTSTIIKKIGENFERL